MPSALETDERALRPQSFTPPLGTGDTADYDRAIRRWTRELRWRHAMLWLVAPQPGETIADIGCGTGSFAIMLKQLHPGVSMIAVDPDEEALRLARGKAGRAGLAIDWRQGFADTVAPASAEAVTSSLVFHQVPLAVKRSSLAAMYRALKPGGRLVLADYGRQSGLMRLLFRVTVQRLDGIEDTQPNADGVLPRLIAEAGFAAVSERDRIHTATGTIAILTARRH
ncbi:ubiquinone/menaquinone biosynthesis C-methylase UbiE [Sphingobium sp. OAS761]|uniref:class I SAM-dependent methyltransferase n=1 Tax=Sphingobium sp. OAS761 TaxID=2817901 RepID=UPI00209F6914|nr:class I SAM-dependent methyltransferase [Sphingobium sp. OAS761]MCP1471982.1 ubiquinone/menaquinone biosynthesis C-methylase UbiE [Sphingobium sp. OAS761]